MITLMQPNMADPAASKTAANASFAPQRSSLPNAMSDPATAKTAAHTYQYSQKASPPPPNEDLRGKRQLLDL